MKTFATTALVTALALAGIAPAQAQRFVETRLDTARVVDVDPIYREGRGRIVQECWNERTSRYDGGYYRDDNGRLYRERDDGTAGAVVGALIGGALGNQVGDGSGRTAATVAGALIGGKVGHDMDERDGYRYRDTRGRETRCRTVETAGRDRLRGYHVTYVYAGERHDTYMRNHPGRRLAVEVDVRQGRRGTRIIDVRPRGEYVANYREWD